MSPRRDFLDPIRNPQGPSAYTRDLERRVQRIERAPVKFTLEHVKPPKKAPDEATKGIVTQPSTPGSLPVGIRVAGVTNGFYTVFGGIGRTIILQIYTAIPADETTPIAVTGCGMSLLSTISLSDTYSLPPVVSLNSQIWVGQKTISGAETILLHANPNYTGGLIWYADADVVDPIVQFKHVASTDNPLIVALDDPISDPDNFFAGCSWGVYGNGKTTAFEPDGVLKGLSGSLPYLWATSTEGPYTITPDDAMEKFWFIAEFKRASP